ncbi:hypothetical protein BKA62DRAFT_724304 [Auriculariales sp. MPI-PUGE-AT-0066]|nr:hypothetical protein BKA62DRAFT_724304 [Auriculariales sp. MPI-PUGE-AT-0066]
MPETIRFAAEPTIPGHLHVPLSEIPPAVDEPFQAAGPSQPTNAATPADATTAPSPTPTEAAATTTAKNPLDLAFLKRGSGMLRFSRAVVGLSLKYFTLVLYIMLAAVPIIPLWRIAFHPETLYLPRATRPGELARASLFVYTMLVLGVLVFGISCAFCLGLIGWRGFRYWINQPVGALHKTPFFTGAGIGASHAFELLGHMLSVISVAGTWMLKPNKRVRIPIFHIECAHIATYTAVGAVFMLWKGYQRRREPLPNPLERGPRDPAFANIASGVGLLVLLGLHSLVSYPSSTLLEQVSPTDLRRVATVAEWVCVWLVQQYLKTLYNDVNTIPEQHRERLVRGFSDLKASSEGWVPHDDKGKAKAAVGPEVQTAAAPLSGGSSTSAPASKEVVTDDVEAANEEMATKTDLAQPSSRVNIPESLSHVALANDAELLKTNERQVAWSSEPELDGVAQAYTNTVGSVPEP